jgi:IclR family acetate operon transcriptional repressor
MVTSNEGSGVPPRRRRTTREPVGAYQIMRTVQALERLAFQALSAPELAAGVQVHPRTARRLLRRLEVERYVTNTDGGRRRYQLTHRLAAIGRQAIAHDPFVRAAAPWVAHLAAATGHIASLWLPCYADVVCVLDAEPGGPLPQPMLGDLEPAHATAPGKALLAHREAWRDCLLARPLQRHTARTLTDPRELRAELARVRARGHATDRGEHHEDVHAIAAPVFLADDAIAAITVSLPAAKHATTDPHPLIAHTASAAAALTRTLQDHH